LLKQTFAKKERIYKKSEISVLLRTGRRWICPFGTVFVFNNNQEAYDRVAVLVSKKLGNSPERNYIKRVCRDIFRSRIRTGPPFFNLLIKPLAKKDFSYEKQVESFNAWVKFIQRPKS
jgi:ribonuclease P protein component